VEGLPTAFQEKKRISNLRILVKYVGFFPEKQKQKQKNNTVMPILFNWKIPDQF